MTVSDSCATYGCLGIMIDPCTGRGHGRALARSDLGDVYICRVTRRRIGVHSRVDCLADDRGSPDKKQKEDAHRGCKISCHFRCIGGEGQLTELRTIKLYSRNIVCGGECFNVAKTGCLGCDRFRAPHLFMSLFDVCCEHP